MEAYLIPSPKNGIKLGTIGGSFLFFGMIIFEWIWKRRRWEINPKTVKNTYDKANGIFVEP